MLLLEARPEGDARAERHGVDQRAAMMMVPMILAKLARP
jgi:hypothetical protein